VMSRRLTTSEARRRPSRARIERSGGRSDGSGRASSV
jgi:hypothetical protein